MGFRAQKRSQSGAAIGTRPVATSYASIFRSSSAASSTWPISRESARASTVALLTSPMADCTPDERSLRRSYFKFCSARPALSSCPVKRERRDPSSVIENELPLEQREPALAIRRILGLALHGRNARLELGDERGRAVGIEMVDGLRQRCDALDERRHRGHDIGQHVAIGFPE